MQYYQILYLCIFSLYTVKPITVIRYTFSKYIGIHFGRIQIEHLSNVCFVNIVVTGSGNPKNDIKLMNCK